MSKPDPTELRVVARLAAQAGAAMALDWRHRADRLRVEWKNDPDDLVSQADRDAESAIRAVLAERRPDDAILGEEQGSVSGTSGVCWVVDPIDGTTSYLHGREDWAVSVAACTDPGNRLLAAVVAEPVLGRYTEADLDRGTWSAEVPGAVRCPPRLSAALVECNFGRLDQRHLAGRMTDALLSSVRDLRRGGSAAAALSRVATGRADAAWIPGVRAWDCAAGALLVQQAGGVVGDLDGPCAGTWPASGDVLAAAPGIWDDLRAALIPVYRP